MSFLMIVSLAYVTIETIDPEPAEASGAFSCYNSDGKAYYFQSTWSGSTLKIIRAESGTDGDASDSSNYIQYTGWAHGNIAEVNSLSMTSDGHMLSLIHI